MMDRKIQKDIHQCCYCNTDLIVFNKLVAHVLPRVLFKLKSSRGSLISTLESEFFNRRLSYIRKP